MTRRLPRLGLPLLALLASFTGCAAAVGPVRGAPQRVDVSPVIVTPSDIATEPELARRGERALIEQRWQDAVDAFRPLVAAHASPEHAAAYLFDLGLALEGAQSRKEARDTFVAFVAAYPDAPNARHALVRAASLDAYLEDWPALAAIGDALAARPDLEDLDRIVALGSRGLARVEMGDDARASADILDGLDLADQHHYGARDVLPVAVAQLRFALGELRRVRSERIVLDPLPGDLDCRGCKPGGGQMPAFLEKLEARCGGLLEAQAAYALAVQSVDPHWAAMAGYRVGAMYRTLHDALVAIQPPPPDPKSAAAQGVHDPKAPSLRDAFYAFMHVRYRVLLEKGLKELEQTLALGERTGDTSPWIERAREAKAQMVADLEAEKARLARMPFTEADILAALDVLQKRSASAAPRQRP